MSNDDVLELASLPIRHPQVGQALLNVTGPPAIIRLGTDPIQLPPGTKSREITVQWVSRHGSTTTARNAIGWNGLTNFSDTLFVQMPVTVNEREITEKGAIGVMSLLIHHLEGGMLQTVLQIGSGGDYFVRVKGLRKQVQIECSGIRIDRDGSASRQRLNQKWDQVLKKSDRGFVSVTAFSHPDGSIVHSYLHFVERRRRKRRRTKARGR